MASTFRIAAADVIHYDPRTDVRQAIEWCDEQDIAALQDALDDGRATLVPGLIGWGHTHTLHVDGMTYHVTGE